MAEFLHTFVPLMLLMLLPVWIPVLAVVFGGLASLVKGGSAKAAGAARPAPRSSGRPVATTPVEG